MQPEHNELFRNLFGICSCATNKSPLERGQTKSRSAILSGVCFQVSIKSEYGLGFHNLAKQPLFTFLNTSEYGLLITFYIQGYLGLESQGKSI